MSRREDIVNRYIDIAVMLDHDGVRCLSLPPEKVRKIQRAYEKSSKRIQVAMKSHLDTFDLIERELRGSQYPRPPSKRPSNVFSLRPRPKKPKPRGRW